MLAESALSRDNDADQRHLENRFGPLGPTRVQIPPPPLFRPTNRDLDLFLGGRALPPRATQERLERLKASWPTMAKPLVAERVQQRDQIAGEGAGVVPALGRVGQPDTTLVDCDDLEVPGQRRHQQAPGIPGLGPAVHQQQRGPSPPMTACWRNSPVSMYRLVNVSVNLQGGSARERSRALRGGQWAEHELMRISFHKT